MFLCLYFCRAPSSISFDALICRRKTRFRPVCCPSSAPAARRSVDSFCFGCDAIAQYRTHRPMLIKRNDWFRIGIGSLLQLSLTRRLLSSACDWLAGAAGTDRRLPGRRVQPRRRSEAPPTSLQRPAAPAPANTAPLREYTPSLRSTTQYYAVLRSIYMHSCTPQVRWFGVWPFQVSASEPSKWLKLIKKVERKIKKVNVSLSFNLR